MWAQYHNICTSQSCEMGKTASQHLGWWLSSIFQSSAFNNSAFNIKLSRSGIPNAWTIAWYWAVACSEPGCTSSQLSRAAPFAQMASSHVHLPLLQNHPLYSPFQRFTKPEWLGTADLGDFGEWHSLSPKKGSITKHDIFHQPQKVRNSWYIKDCLLKITLFFAPAPLLFW